MPLGLRRALKGAGFALAFVVIATIGSHLLARLFGWYYNNNGVEIPLAVRILMAVMAFWMTFWWVCALPLICFGLLVGAFSAFFAKPPKAAAQRGAP